MVSFVSALTGKTKPWVPFSDKSLSSHWLRRITKHSMPCKRLQVPRYTCWTSISSPSMGQKWIEYVPVLQCASNTNKIWFFSIFLRIIALGLWVFLNNMITPQIWYLLALSFWLELCNICIQNHSCIQILLVVYMLRSPSQVFDSCWYFWSLILKAEYLWYTYYMIEHIADTRFPEHPTTTYTPPNHSGGVWLNWIFSTNHLGT